MHESSKHMDGHPHDRSATADLVSALDCDGLAWFEGLADSADLVELARSIAKVVPHRDSGSDGVTTIADLGEISLRTGFAGFSASALKPHTDRSGVAHPPELLIMSCGFPASTGGECMLIDGKSVYDDLAESRPDAVRAFSTPHSALFGGAAGYLGSIFTPLVGGRIAVRLRLDELAQFAPEVTRWLPILLSAIDRHTVIVRLAAGQGYIVRNSRWLHGRRAFTGQRIIYRVIGNPLEHLDIPSGFQPARRISLSTAA